MTKILPLFAFCSMSVYCLTTAAQTDYISEHLREPMPAQWSLQPEAFQSLPTEDDWWQTLGDPTLIKLLDMAESNNFDILATAKRIEAARQSLNEVRAAYFPTVSANAGWTKLQNSGRQTATSVPATDMSYFSLGLSAQWEVDLFGRVAANARTSRQAYNATRAEYAGAMVSLAANVAKAYINLRLYQEQLHVAQAHIEQQRKVTVIAEARFEAGLGNMLEVNQARIVLYSTEASLPGLEAMVKTSVNAIALLTGRYPNEIAELLAQNERDLPEVTSVFGTGVPLDLLRRRPDIVQSELNMAQLAAQIGVQKKDFLPTLSITGAIGTSAHKADALFGSHSMTYSVAPQLSWTIFDGLARNYRVAEARADFEAAIDSYNLTVMTALQEVDNAMINYTESLKTIQLYKKVVEASHDALRLSMERYKQGLSEFTNVADAQINYLTYQNSLVSSKAKTLTALISLYEALGGGWNGSLPD
ncbi:MAG: TolC family protein [Muribaculaceae bacterium]|nr:TolC family protein [Muribaculaceae bacterium]